MNISVVVKVTLLLLIMLGSFSCETTETTNPMFTHETIIQVHHLTKAQIISKSKIWITQNFHSAKNAIGHEDSKAGVLIGNATIKVPISGDEMHDMKYNFILEAKDGRFKITYSGFMWADDSEPSYLYHEETQKYYMNKFSEYNASLKLSLITNGAQD
jgi:hypothetical protein